MKLLNPDKPESLPKVYPRAVPAEVVVCDVEDSRVAYDTNDMSLQLLDEDDEQPRGSTAEIQCAPVLHDQPCGLCLCISDVCNLRCDYCYVWPEAHVSPSTKIMQDRTILRAIDLLGRPRRQVDVSFFGGEPTMAWDKIKFAVERLDQFSKITGAPVKYHLTTNGTLLKPSRAAFLAKHNFGLIVSLDGGREHHDRHRKTAKGVGSYDLVLGGLRHLKDHGLAPRVTLRGTFVPGEWGEAAERLEAMNDLCDKDLAGSVALEPAALSEWDCTGGKDNYADDEMQKFIDAGTDWAIARARAGKVVRWTYLQNILFRLVKRAPAFTECGAGTGYVSVSPDGEIHACHLRCGKIGNATWGIDEVARQDWVEPRMTAHEKCNSCWARRLCGGGCRAFNRKCSGSVHTPAKLYCDLAIAKARAAMRVLVTLRDEKDALNLVMGGKPKGCGSDCCEKPAESVTSSAPSDAPPQSSESAPTPTSPSTP